VKALARRLLIRTRGWALGPVLGRLEAMEASMGGRLDELTKRVDEMDAVVQMLEARAATGAERSVTQSESQARLARRIQEIERRMAGSEVPAEPGRD
jgi:hypothetical protein